MSSVVGPLDLLRTMVEVCCEVPVEYAVIGAIARNAWAPPRATADLDLAVAVGAEQYGALEEALARRGIVVKRRSSVDLASGVPDLVLLEAPHGPVRRVDLLVAKTAFELEAIRTSVEVDIGVPCRIVDPLHLIVYKLIAGRPRDLDDCVEVLRTRALGGKPVDVDRVRKWAAEWNVEPRLDEVLRLANAPEL
jgi:hypothetical protein